MTQDNRQTWLERVPWAPWIALAGIVSFGLFLRVHNLHAETPWCDEVVSLNCLDSPDLATFLHEYHKSDPPMQPVYFTIEHFWAKATGGSVVSMRWLSVAFGILSMAMLFLVGRAIFGNAAGLVAAICLAISMPHVYYSQEIRNYALTSLTTLVAAYTFLRGLETAQRRWWAANVAANAALVGTHLFGAGFLLVQGVFLLVRRWRAPKWIALWVVANVAALLPCYLWARLINIGHIAKWASIFGYPSLRDFANFLVVFTGARISNWNPAPLLPYGVSLDLPLAALVYGGIACFVGHALWRRRHNNGRANAAFNDTDAIVFLCLWLIVPLAALYVASYVLQPCFQYRYILYTLLAVCLLMGGALAALPGRRSRALIGAVLVAMYGYQLLALTGGPLRADMQAAAACVAQKGAPRDLVLVFKDWNASSFRFASSHPDDRIVCIEPFGDLVRVTEEAHARDEGVWVIMHLWEHPEWLGSEYRKRGLVFTEQRFGRWPFVHVFHVPASGPEATATAP